MNMHIVVPSGMIYLNGHLVQGKRKPYIMIGNVKSFLSDDEKKLATEMRKAFAPIIDRRDAHAARDSD